MPRLCSWLRFCFVFACFFLSFGPNALAEQKAKPEGRPLSGLASAASPASSSASIPRDGKVSVLPLTSTGLSSTYTMEEAVHLALEANPSVESSRYSLDAAESGRKAARSAFGPSVSTSYSLTHYDKPRVNRNDRNAYTWGVNASQPLFTGFNLLNSYQKASLQRDNQALQLEKTRLNIVSQVQDQFLAYLKARENIRSTEQSLDRAKAQLALAQASYNVGLRPRLDVLQAELDVSRTQATLIQAENSREICRAGLNTLLNLPVDSPTEFMGDLELIPFALTLEECLAQAFQRRPDLLMAQKSVEIAQKDLGLAHSAFFPQLSAALGWNTTGNTLKAAGGTYNSTNYSQWQIGLNVQWMLTNSGKRWHGAEQAKSQISALRAQLQAAFNTCAYEIKTCLLKAQDAKRTVSVAARSVISARESYNDAKMRYELQLGTNLDLLTAQSSLANAELSLISARVDYLTALSKLYIAMGEIRPALRQ